MQTLTEPKIITRQPETVFYVQEKGDYSKTPKLALEKLTKLLTGKGGFQSIYGMGLDNPHTTNSEACRFDACAKMKLDENVELAESVQKKEIEGGRFAVFVHEGPYSELTATCNRIFQEWFPKSGYEPSGPLFCKYVNYFDESAKVKVTKIYVPIKI